MTNFTPSSKYTYAISENTFTLLDIQLTIESNHYKSYVHFKATDIHNYNTFFSSLSTSCYHFIPFSQLLRNKRRCSFNVAFSLISNQVANYFSTRQKPKHIIWSPIVNFNRSFSLLSLDIFKKSLSRRHTFLCPQLSPLVFTLSPTIQWPRNVFYIINVLISRSWFETSLVNVVHRHDFQLNSNLITNHYFTYSNAFTL